MAPAVGIYLLRRMVYFPIPHTKTTVERLCGKCGLDPKGGVFQNDLIHSLLDTVPTDVPPALKQTALTHIPPEMTLPDGRSVIAVVTERKRAEHKSSVHPSILRQGGVL